jgi:putative ABC transport system permease protein
MAHPLLVLPAMLQDLRDAFRALRRRPAFALIAIATLGLGIGATTSVFSVAQGALLRPLPLRAPERLVLVWETHRDRKQARNVVNPANYLAWRERSRSFEALAAFTPFVANVTGLGDPVRLDVGYVTPSFFDTLGVAPASGRALQEADAQEGAAGAVVLGHALWQRYFGGDPGVLGRVLTVNGRPTTIVGVMRPDFRVPPRAEAWLPYRPDPAARGRFLAVAARLRDGVTLAEARAEMDTIAAGLAAEVPERDAGWGVDVKPLHADLVRDVKPAVLVLGGAVLLVLLIACGNVANLLLASALAREREMAIRQSLGASRLRLFRQVAAESLLLGLAGAATGVLVSTWMTKALLTVVPPELLALFPIGLDGRVLAFAAGMGVISALVFGPVAALHAARPAPVASLREGSRGSGWRPERRRVSRLLAGAEVALSVLLLVGASLLLRSFARLAEVDPGFAAAGVQTFEVSLPRASYPEEARRARFFLEAEARLARVAGIEAVGAMSWRPLGLGSSTSFTLPDRPAPAQGAEPVADVRIVTPGALPALGVRLLRGRGFTAEDDATRPTVILVNEGMARAYWPGQDAIGKRVHMEWGSPRQAEVVGVVSDVHLVALETAPRATLYWAQAQLPNDFMTFLARTRLEQPALLAAARREIAALDPSLPLARPARLEEVVSETLDRRRFLSLLAASFGVAAALLAALGLYGVLAYSVRQRVPEMGVRLALGALPTQVMRLVMRDALLIVAGGALAGLAAAAFSARLLESLLFQLSSRDPLAFAGAAALVVAVGALAAALPARRASRVDPAVALRAE